MLNEAMDYFGGGMDGARFMCVDSRLNQGVRENNPGSDLI